MKICDLLEFNETRTEPTPLNYDPNINWEEIDRIEDMVFASYLKKHPNEKGTRGLTRNANDAESVVQTVPISKVYGIESKLVKSHLDKLLNDKSKQTEYPLAYVVDGKYVIQDGNHRAAALKLKGNKSIKLRVIDPKNFK